MSGYVKQVLNNMTNFVGNIRMVAEASHFAFQYGRQFDVIL